MTVTRYQVGPQGDPGPEGPTGATGPKGDQGDPGPSVTVTDGDTTVSDISTLTFTSGATVTDGGSGNAEVAIP